MMPNPNSNPNPNPDPNQETAFTLLELRDMMAAARLQPVSVFFASLQQECRRTLVRCTLDALCARCRLQMYCRCTADALHDMRMHMHVHSASRVHLE